MEKELWKTNHSLLQYHKFFSSLCCFPHRSEFSPVCWAQRISHEKTLWADSVHKLCPLCVWICSFYLRSLWFKIFDLNLWNRKVGTAVPVPEQFPNICSLWTSDKRCCRAAVNNWGERKKEKMDGKSFLRHFGVWRPVHQSCCIL